MSGRRARPGLVALAAAAAMCVGVPAAAFGQAAVGSGSAASEYGDYVPTTSGTSTKHASTPKHSSTPRHSAPTRRYYAPPVRHYTASARSSAPRVTYSAPAASSSQKSGGSRAAHRKRRHHPHHAAAAHRVAKPAPGASKSGVDVPNAPVASVDGGSGQLVLLGLAMLTMTVAVFTRAGWRRRHGSA